MTSGDSLQPTVEPTVDPGAEDRIEYGILAVRLIHRDAVRYPDGRLEVVAAGDGDAAVAAWAAAERERQRPRYEAERSRHQDDEARLAGRGEAEVVAARAERDDAWRRFGAWAGQCEAWRERFPGNGVVLAVPDDGALPLWAGADGPAVRTPAFDVPLRGDGCPVGTARATLPPGHRPYRLTLDGTTWHVRGAEGRFLGTVDEVSPAAGAGRHVPFSVLLALYDERAIRAAEQRLRAAVQAGPEPRSWLGRPEHPAASEAGPDFETWFGAAVEPAVRADHREWIVGWRSRLEAGQQVVPWTEAEPWPAAAVVEALDARAARGWRVVAVTADVVPGGGPSGGPTGEPQTRYLMERAAHRP